MRILVNSGPDSVVKSVGRQVYAEHLGCLTQPRSWNNVARAVTEFGAPWAADNDCFQGLDEDAYRKMLDSLQGIPNCLFVVVPDVVGDAAATLARFTEWVQVVRGYGYPLAFVAQDGQEALPVPWDEFEALFIGGSTAWKLGQHAARIADEALARGKWLHMGRVNSRRRLQYARALGCHSVDGTGYSRWKKLILPHLPALTQPYNLTFMGELT